MNNPDAQKLHMKILINKYTLHFLRYVLPLQNILKETPAGHEDLEKIPAILKGIKGLGKEAEPGIASAKRKVELWRYGANLVFRAGEQIVCLFCLVRT